jgi:hypothetical protein
VNSAAQHGLGSGGLFEEVSRTDLSDWHFNWEHRAPPINSVVDRAGFSDAVAHAVLRMDASGLGAIFHRCCRMASWTAGIISRCPPLPPRRSWSCVDRGQQKTRPGSGRARRAYVRPSCGVSPVRRESMTTTPPRCIGSQQNHSRRRRTTCGGATASSISVRPGF